MARRSLAKRGVTANALETHDDRHLLGKMCVTFGNVLVSLGQLSI